MKYCPSKEEKSEINKEIGDTYYEIVLEKGVNDSKKEKEEAIKYLCEYLELDKAENRVERYKKIAILYERMDENDKAIENYKNCIIDSSDTEKYEIKKEIGKLYMRVKDYKNANEYFNSAKDLFKEDNEKKVEIDKILIDYYKKSVYLYL